MRPHRWTERLASLARRAAPGPGAWACGKLTTKPLAAEPLSAVEAPPKAGAVRAARGANGCFVGGMRGLCTDLQATRETSSEELVSARYGELM